MNFIEQTHQIRIYSRPQQRWFLQLEFSTELHNSLCSRWDDNNREERKTYRQAPWTVFHCTNVWWVKLQWKQTISQFSSDAMVSPSRTPGASRNRTLHRSQVTAVKCWTEKTLFQPIWVFFKYLNYISALLRSGMIEKYDRRKEKMWRRETEFGGGGYIRFIPPPHIPFLVHNCQGY